MSDPTIALVGSDGVVGTAIAEHLGRSGVAISIRITGEELRVSGPAAIAGALKGAESLICAAGVAHTRARPGSAGRYRCQLFEGTVALNAKVAYAAGIAGIKRLVLISSSKAAGHSGDPTMVTKLSYGTAKAVGEAVAYSFAGQLAILRIGALIDVRSRATLVKYGRYFVAAPWLPRSLLDRELQCVTADAVGNVVAGLVGGRAGEGVGVQVGHLWQSLTLGECLAALKDEAVSLGGRRLHIGDGSAAPNWNKLMRVVSAGAELVWVGPAASR